MFNYFAVHIEAIAVWLIAILLGAGMFTVLLYDEDFGNSAIIESARGKINTSFKKIMVDKNAEDNLLKGTSFYLHKDLYSLIRFSLLALIVIVGVVSKSIVGLGFAVILYVVSVPKEYSKKNSALPWHYVLNAIKSIDNNRKDDELLDALSILKNLVVQQKYTQISLNYILEHLSEGAYATAPAYQKMRMQISLGRKEEALKVFTEEVNTQIGKEMALLLLQFDDLDSGQLEQAVLAKQNMVREKKATRINSKDQLIAVGIYTIALIGVMLTLLDFVYVAFFKNADLYSMII